MCSTKASRFCSQGPDHWFPCFGVTGEAPWASCPGGDQCKPPAGVWLGWTRCREPREETGVAVAQVPVWGLWRPRVYSCRKEWVHGAWPSNRITPRRLVTGQAIDQTQGLCAGFPRRDWVLGSPTHRLGAGFPQCTQTGCSVPVPPQTGCWGCSAPLQRYCAKGQRWGTVCAQRHLGAAGGSTESVMW